MKSISQRELRNDNAEVIRKVLEGESYVVTRRGVPVARIVPMDSSGLRCDRPATKSHDYLELMQVELDTPSAAILDELRGER